MARATPRSRPETRHRGRTVWVTQNRTEEHANQRARDPHGVQAGACHQQRASIGASGCAGANGHGIALIDRELGQQRSQESPTGKRSRHRDPGSDETKVEQSASENRRQDTAPRGNHAQGRKLGRPGKDEHRHQHDRPGGQVRGNREHPKGCAKDENGEGDGGRRLQDLFQRPAGPHTDIKEDTPTRPPPQAGEGFLRLAVSGTRPGLSPTPSATPG